MPRLLRLPLLTLLALAALVSLPLRAGAATASAPGMEADFVGRVNALRSSLGLPGVSVDGNLVAVADGHTAEMIAAGGLFHAPDLSVGVTSDWQKLGENVGRGSNVDAVWNAFVNSPAHYANLVDPRFTRIGIAVTEADGMIWTTQRFLQPAAAPAPSPAPAPAPTPAATPAPQPTPAPAPATTAPAPAAPTTTAAPAPEPVPTTQAPADPAPARPGHVDALLVAIRALP